MDHHTTDLWWAFKCSSGYWIILMPTELTNAGHDSACISQRDTLTFAPTQELPPTCMLLVAHNLANLGPSNSPSLISTKDLLMVKPEIAVGLHKVSACSRESGPHTPHHLVGGKLYPHWSHFTDLSQEASFKQFMVSFGRFFEEVMFLKVQSFMVQGKCFCFLEIKIDILINWLCSEQKKTPAQGLQQNFAYLCLLCLCFVAFKGPFMVIFNSGTGIQCCNPDLEVGQKSSSVCCW